MPMVLNETHPRIQDPSGYTPGFTTVLVLASRNETGKLHLWEIYQKEK